ncbi:hypothetical protein FSP39_009354 [Pinctada imbricata]|uniref:Reverse transcriptase domain-containing protein n=1 Tax=Pinctada imbricata TaxID=66713 RepID=A0AA88YNC1_PINIB|nr:hypothetical protein FSP39_009354 [Pinctada imbricata]
MLYGVASAPAIWQRAIEQVLQGLPGVQCILDDMVITGRNDKEHIENLAKGTVRRNKLTSGAIDSEVFAIETDWFRFANDRAGGRMRWEEKKREKKKNSKRSKHRQKEILMNNL